MEHQITSVDNEKIKELRKLNQPKYRWKLGLFFVENAVIIRDAMDSGINYGQLYVTEAFKSREADLFEGLVQRGDYFLIDEKVNKSFSNLDTPAGICAVYEIRENQFAMSDRIIYLNRINDPGNLGTILRSALAFGFTNIVMDKECADIYNYKTIQAAKDAIFKLAISIDEDGKVFSSIKKALPVYATSLQGGTDLEEIKGQDKFCLILGNESHGVDQSLLAQADKLIKIKMTKDIESLNVASSAAIIFYELYKG